MGTLKSNDYTFVFQAGTLTVTPAVLTVAAVNASRAYGLTNPTLTYTISGFVNGETATTGGVTGTPALSTTAIASSSVGTYPITVGLGTLNGNQLHASNQRAGHVDDHAGSADRPGPEPAAVLWYGKPAAYLHSGP